MKKVFIKHNPYKLETEIKVDGKSLELNSTLGERITDTRIQEWVEELPEFLVEEFNVQEFDVDFHGTGLDYEDLALVMQSANENGHISRYYLNHIPAKESTDKEELIGEIFQEILNSSLDDLKTEDIKSAFEQARSEDFEVSVVATMSAGKSTLINALLGKKLMPSMQQACTATISRIKDITKGDENVPFRAKVFNAEKKLLETNENLTLGDMLRLNSNKDVSEIKIEGHIPFVSSEEMSLVLVDTPGPNYSSDPHHKIVQEEMLLNSSKALILYVMTGTLGTNDDSALLERIAESMKVGGKQSKDRFIFVINKLDTRKQEDGEPSKMLDKVREYLEGKKIFNPNLFPTSALTALNIRLLQNDEEIDEDSKEETAGIIKKLNRNKNFHYEKYTSLPRGIHQKIEKQLDTTVMKWTEAGNKPNENPDEALVHTGILSLEASIRQYVEKYAKTAKIKNIVDTFSHHLESTEYYEKLKNAVVSDHKKYEQIGAQIKAIKSKISDGEEAKKYKDTVEMAVKKTERESKDAVEKIIGKFASKIRLKLLPLKGKELSAEDARNQQNELFAFFQQLEPEFVVEVEKVIQETLINTNNVLLNGYITRLASLIDEMDPKSVIIEPLKLMGGNLGGNPFSGQKKAFYNINEGQEYIPNTDKKWYKPWTWLQENGYYRSYTYVKGEELADNFAANITRHLDQNGISAKNYGEEKANEIGGWFKAEFKRLDKVLTDKLDELDSYASDFDQAEARKIDSQRKIDQLDKIKTKLNLINEI